MADEASTKLSPRGLEHLNKGKKRKLSINGWHKSKKRLLKNSGKEYVGTNGKVVLAKPLPEEVDICSCKVFGCKLLSKDDRVSLFTAFYKKSYNEQQEYLAASVELCDIQRRRTNEAVSRRHCSYKYFVRPSPQNKVQICMKVFKNVYSLTSKRMQILQSKMKGDESLEDQRGTHNNRPRAISHEIKDMIREHIKSFPSQESHYSRVKNKLMCLSPDLNVKKMADLFNEMNPDNRVNVHLYREMFKSEFHLRFGAPRSDTCPKCDLFFVRLANSTSADERRKISVESELHHRKAEKSYASLQDDVAAAKENPGLHVIFTDLEQVLFSPNLKYSNVFYQRQYSSYNYAVHDAQSGNATMFLWHESVAKRGSAEIASCLLKYVSDNFDVLVGAEERKLVVWSDRCVGQNNNWKMFSLLQFFVTAKYLTQTEQKFLCSGHSFLPCDRDFALIERKKKAAVINVPFDWVELIVSARPSNPFLVTVMQTDDFKDFTQLESAVYRNPKLKITGHMWYRFETNNPYSVSSRVGHNISQPWTMFSLKILRQQNRGAAVTKKHQIPCLYQGPIPIKKEKKADLIAMSALLQNPEHHKFYEDLLVVD